MIRTHNANSRWWGAPVGLITDPGFFAVDTVTRKSLLAPYVWVEFKAPLATAPPAHVLREAGFAWTDVQVHFRIGLKSVPESPSLQQYECVSAAEQAFVIAASDLKPFEHERFLQLPDARSDLLGERYATWANELIARHPACCLRLTLDGRTQGWFLAEANGGTITLTLAMLAGNAVASGQHLYQRSLREFASRGSTIGHAAFSVRNTPVMNIYASLGAKFTVTTGVWMWIADRSRTPGIGRQAEVDPT